LGGRVKHTKNGKEKEKFKTYLNGDRGRSLWKVELRKKNGWEVELSTHKKRREKEKFKTYLTNLSQDRGRSLWKVELRKKNGREKEKFKTYLSEDRRRSL
jgi:hypothetical protein